MWQATSCSRSQSANALSASVLLAPSQVVIMVVMATLRLAVMFLLVLALVRGERPPVRLSELGLRDRHSFETPTILSAHQHHTILNA